MTKTIKRKKSIHITLSVVSILFGIAITLPFFIPKHHNTNQKQTKKVLTPNKKVLSAHTNLWDAIGLQKLIGNQKEEPTPEKQITDKKNQLSQPSQIPKPSLLESPLYDFTVLSVKPSTLGGEPILVYSFSNPTKYNLNTDCDPSGLLWRSSDDAPIYAVNYDSRYGWTMSNGRQYYGYVANNSLPDDTYYVRIICKDNKEYSSKFQIVSGTYPAPSSIPTDIHNTIVIFDDRPVNTRLNGTFAGINWGTNVWDVDRVIATSSINSLAFHAPNATTGTFSFTKPQVLVSTQMYNDSNQVSLITLACAGNPNISAKITPNTAATVTTDWNIPCTTVTVTSSNGRNTSINSIIYANASTLIAVADQQTKSQTLGNTTQGSLIDSGDKSYMNGSKFITGTNEQTATALSVFVGNVDIWPNNQYQLAIYTDNNGVPGTLVARTTSGTLKPLAWNTLPITAKLSANTPYWLMYNTNARSTDLNNIYYDSNSSGVGAWAKQPFGTWPTKFPPASTDAINFSIYATLQ
jgi:hypothetical protein